MTGKEKAIEILNSMKAGDTFSYSVIENGRRIVYGNKVFYKMMADRVAFTPQCGSWFVRFITDDMEIYPLIKEDDNSELEVIF